MKCPECDGKGGNCEWCDGTGEVCEICSQPFLECFCDEDEDDYWNDDWDDEEE